MRAVILVGGEGTRMRPLTCHTPKPMLPVVNRPFLEHMLDWLKRYGIDDVVLSMCYKPDVIQAHFGDGDAFGVTLNYAVEQSPLGTAGAVKNAQQHLDDTCFVFNGDILTDLDLGAMLEFHRAKRAKVTIALTPVENPAAYGLVDTDANRRIRRFLEKPTPEQMSTVSEYLINAGTYVLEPEVLELVPPDTFYMFERGLFPTLLERGEPMYGYPSDAYWIDIGTPEKYLTVHRDIMLGRIALPMPGQRMADGLWAGRDCHIDATAKIAGPVVLGDGVTIRSEATLNGPMVVGSGCTLGAGATVEDAVIWGETNIGARATLKACVVAARCTIGEGASLSNCAVVADDCIIGTGNRLDHGIRVWPGTTLAANCITF